MGMGIFMGMGIPWDSRGNGSQFFKNMGMGWEMGMITMGMGIVIFKDSHIPMMKSIVKNQNSELS